MFDTWISPALAAVVAGAALWGTMLAPLLMYQVRAYGGLSLSRAGGAAAVSIYGVALVAYTLLPTPGADSWCSTDHGGTMELDALHSIDDIRWAVSAYGPVGALTSFTVLQVAMNVVLFVPWGVLARRYFHMPFVLAVLSGAFASLAIELTQYSGGLTLVGCQYRVADIDDLIANSLGALIGAILAPLFLFWMPPARALAAERLRPRRVTGLRRAAAVLVDLTILWVVAFAVAHLFAGVSAVGSIGPSMWADRAGALLVGWLAVAVPTLGGSGRTWGQRMLWLRPAWHDGARAVRARAVTRAVVGAGLYAAAMAAAGMLTETGDLSEYVWVASYAWALLLLVWTAVDPGGGPLDRVTGAITVDVRGVAELEDDEPGVEPGAQSGD